MIDPRQLRSIMPAIAVVMTALLAAFAHFTLPRMETLGALRTEYEGLNEQAAEIGRPSVQPAAPDTGAVAQFVDHVQALNSMIGEPSSAYDRLVEMARCHGLQVESIKPSRSEKESGRIELFGWIMVATGEFAQAVEFIDALNATEGLHRVASLRLAPAMGANSTALTLTLNVEFVRVLVPDSLRSTGGSGPSGASEEVSP